MAKNKKFLSEKIMAIVAMVIVILLAGFFGWYRPHQIKQEKQGFLDAQANIEQLYTQIEAKIGKPTQIKRVDYCHYQSQEFGRGDRSCSVGIYAFYKNVDTDRANSLMQSSASVVGTPIRDSLNEGSSEFTATNNKTQVFYENYSSTMPACSLGYYYPFKFYDPDVTTTKDLRIELSCSSDAQSEYYPVLDDPSSI